MSKLSDTQLILLSNAAQRDDGVVVMPDRLKGSAAANVAKGLLGKGLIEEVAAKNGMPVWRRGDGKGQSYALTITSAGRAATNAEADGPRDEAGLSTVSAGRKSSPRPTRLDRKRAGRAKPSAKSGSAPRAGSKQALVIKMLQRSKGATLDDLTKATDWLPHTTRAALTGLRKRGYRIEREHDGDRDAVYRIVAGSRRAA